jgi:type IV pilus assembly protein PilO
MTISGNLSPSQGRAADVDSPYPVLFGIPFTPVLTGIIAASIGLIGAIWLLMTYVQPLWQQKQELEQSVTDKEAQIANQQNTLKEITKVENDLKLAQRRQAEVLSLYADPDQLKTLLLDLNQIAQERTVKLTKFEPSTPEPETVSDSSVGPGVNGKLKRQIYKIELEGTFEATRATVLTLERLQPLLLVKNLKSQSGSQKATLRKTGNQAAVLDFDPEADDLKTSFDLIALMPLNPPSLPVETSPVAPAAATSGAKPTTAASPPASPTPQ